MSGPCPSPRRGVRRSARLAVLVALSAVLLGGCDLPAPDTHHANNGGFQGCEASSVHQVVGSDFFRSQTSEWSHAPCTRVAARVFVWGYDGVHWGTVWDWDPSSAWSGITGVSSDVADHQVCRFSTPCAGGTN